MLQYYQRFLVLMEVIQYKTKLKAEMKGIVSSISAAQGDSLNVDDVIITLAELDETK